MHCIIFTRDFKKSHSFSTQERNRKQPLGSICRGSRPKGTVRVTLLPSLMQEGGSPGHFLNSKLVIYCENYFRYATARYTEQSSILSNTFCRFKTTSGSKGLEYFTALFREKSLKRKKRRTLSNVAPTAPKFWPDLRHKAPWHKNRVFLLPRKVPIFSFWQSSYIFHTHLKLLTCFLM